MKIGGICLNWKVVGGLTLAGVAVFIAAPGVAWSILPFLLIAACPLSMLFMMRGMHSGQHGAHCASEHTPVPKAADLALTREEQLVLLRAQLVALETQEAAIARELDQLEPAEPLEPATVAR